MERGAEHFSMEVVIIYVPAFLQTASESLQNLSSLTRTHKRSTTCSKLLSLRLQLVSAVSCYLLSCQQGWLEPGMVVCSIAAPSIKQPSAHFSVLSQSSFVSQ
eukprot:TRINITY_DN5505_c0_g1_i2.p2 TRINITY_DN5505_c0_g1~~TRINITY_DN5505_c0_g1_i2.p2  ORF type:complete len:103 (+),score=13.90 TRINITY_DN5505_c0_g1_i2:1019-1327(+)